MMCVLRFVVCLTLTSLFGFSVEKPDPDQPTPQQEEALSHYLEAVASTGVKGTTIALQVVDQFGKPIDRIPVKSTISTWKRNPFGIIRFNSPAFSLEWGAGMTSVNGIASITSPERWYDMALCPDIDRFDQRVISRRDDQDHDSNSDIIRVDSGGIEAFKKGEQHSQKPVYSKKKTLYRTVGPEQLLLDTKFMCQNQENFIRQDRTYSSIAADFIRRGSNAEPRYLRTPAEIVAADEDMILHFGEVPDPKRIQPGLNATGGWDHGTPYTIWLELECRRGGLRIADEPYPYTAPLDGYSRKLRFELSTGKDNAIGRFRGLVWIRRNGTPVRYGILQYDILHSRTNRGQKREDSVTPYMKLWFNPTGSRNLERPGPGQFDPHSTPEGKSVMLWRPEPMLLRPDNNLEGEFSGPYVDINPKYGPQWFAEPRQAGAIRLLDDPPDEKKP